MQSYEKSIDEAIPRSCASAVLTNSKSLVDCLTEGAGQLVGAGCRLRAAAYPSEARDGVGGSHPLDQSRYALEVAVTATNEGHIRNHAIIDREVDLA